MAAKAECSQKGWERGFKDLVFLLELPFRCADEAWELSMFRCCSKVLQNSISLRQSTIATREPATQSAPNQRQNTEKIETSHRLKANCSRSDLKDRGGQKSATIEIAKLIKSPRQFIFLEPESAGTIQPAEIWADRGRRRGI